eukprot:768781-Hanusia_phi.AAC.2
MLSLVQQRRAMQQQLSSPCSVLLLHPINELIEVRQQLSEGGEREERETGDPRNFEKRKKSLWSKESGAGKERKRNEVEEKRTRKGGQNSPSSCTEAEHGDGEGKPRRYRATMAKSFVALRIHRSIHRLQVVQLLNVSTDPPPPPPPPLPFPHLQLVVSLLAVQPVRGGLPRG